MIEEISHVLSPYGRKGLRVANIDNVFADPPKDNNLS